MLDQVNDILATAASGEELAVAQKAVGDTVRFDVPDFDAGVAAYQDGTGSVEELVLAKGKYRSIWNREKLAKVLSLAGFDIVGGVDGPKWSSGDGWLRVIAKRTPRPKPKLPMRDIRAIMSLPRVAWTDTMCATNLACASLGIDMMRASGVFWGQCMQRMMEAVVKDGQKYILTIDYDSIFDPEDIVRLWQIMETRPEVDALFPLQIGRDREACLISMVDENGQRVREIEATEFRKEVLPCQTGHFGLTLLRVEALQRMPKPWFVAKPTQDGGWGDGRMDDDIWFWHQFNAAGNRCFVSPRVRIGHLQLIVTWPGEDLRTIHQYTTKYGEDGRPAECRNF